MPYLSGLGVDVGQGVFPPVLLEGLLLLTLQRLGVVVLIHTVLQEPTRTESEDRLDT